MYFRSAGLTSRDVPIFLFFHLFFFPAILFSDLFCLKDPKFVYIFTSSQTSVTALLEYFVNGVCSMSMVTVLLDYLDLYNYNKIVFDISIKIMRPLKFHHRRLNCYL